MKTITAMIFLVFTVLYNFTYASSEAGYACFDGSCATPTPRSNIMQFCESMRTRAAWARDWQCQNTGLFDNGTQRENIHDLRRQNFNSLTSEEQAILKGADKVGALGLCNGSGGNAFLIEYQGRPAIVTAAHLLINPETGKSRCTMAELEEQASYLPNSSYYDPNNPDHNRDFYMRSVDLEVPPINFDEALRSLQSSVSDHTNTSDFIIMFLKEDITKDKMPAGHTRSYFKPSTHMASRNGQGLYMLGVAPDRHSGLAMNYQSGCNYEMSSRYNGVLMHDCSTVRGSSGSFLGQMENGELTFSGVHNYSRIGNNTMEGPSTSFKPVWNSGVSVREILP